MRKRRPPPKRRNPMARLLRTLRPQRVRNRKAYTRKGRCKTAGSGPDPGGPQ